MKPPFAILARRIAANLYAVSSDDQPELEGAFTWEEVCRLQEASQVTAVLVLNQTQREPGELAVIEYRPTVNTPLSLMTRPPLCRVPLVTAPTVGRPIYPPRAPRRAGP